MDVFSTDTIDVVTLPFSLVKCHANQCDIESGLVALLQAIFYPAPDDVERQSRKLFHFMRAGNGEISIALDVDTHSECTVGRFPSFCGTESGSRYTALQVHVIAQAGGEEAGVLSAVAKPFAASRIGIDNISTYNQNFMLVEEGHLEKAIAILRLELSADIQAVRRGVVPHGGPEPPTMAGACGETSGSESQSQYEAEDEYTTEADETDSGTGRKQRSQKPRNVDLRGRCRTSTAESRGGSS